MSAIFAAGPLTVAAEVTGPGGALLALESGGILDSIDAGIQLNLDALNALATILNGWNPTTPLLIPIAGALIKSAPGVLGSATSLNTAGVAAFLQVHNKALASGLNDASVIATSVSVNNNSPGSPTIPTLGLVANAGIVLAWSLTQYTYTPVAASTGYCWAAYR